MRSIRMMLAAGILVVAATACPTTTPGDTTSTTVTSTTGAPSSTSAATSTTKVSTPSSTSTTTTTPPPVTIGAPSDAGLTIPATSLKPWTGSYTITPTSPGVVNGRVEGYLFSQTTYVSGNVTFVNDKWEFTAPWHVIVQGHATPGPTFTHIEINGRNTTGGDDDGITNSLGNSPAGDKGSPMTIDRSHLYKLVNGGRLYSDATMTNTLIDQLATGLGAHTDGLEIYCGSRIVVDHTTIDASPWAKVNSSIETQGDAATGGFCPVDHVTISHDHFIQGVASLRFDDDKITHITVDDVLLTGPFLYFSTAVDTPANVDLWRNVRTEWNGKTTYISTAQTFGCGAPTDYCGNGG